MHQLPFGELPPYRKRSFVPDGLDWDSLEDLEALFRQLLERGKQPGIEKWLDDWQELNAALDEEAARRYIAMTSHTDDPDLDKSYLRLVEEILPKVKPLQFAFHKAYVEHPERASLDKRRYEAFDRDVAVEVELYRDENVPLETEAAKLSQQYVKLSGSLTVEFDGREQTLAQMAKYLEETDRELRQSAWEAAANRRLQERDGFDGIYDTYIDVLQQIASNAGFDNYRDYSFKNRRRFDYTAEDCLRFHDCIEELIMPLVRKLHESRRQRLGVETLRPWDTAADPDGLPPLRPFEGGAQLEKGTQRIFDRLDPDLAEGIRTMRSKKLFDLENRKGKAPGGYQYTLSEARLPFIFMNAIGVSRDVETMLHEAGHAFHALAVQNEDFSPYRSAPIEFAEVASMSMELLGSHLQDEFYSEEELKRARRNHLEGIITFFPWMAVIDGFQHWVYTHKGHSRDERRAFFTSLMQRFGGEIDWSGYEQVRANLWHRQPHLFGSPFYYVEYGIAQIGALRVWLNYKKDAREGLGAYKRALALGGSRPLPELFEAAGAPMAFDAETIRPLCEMLVRELEALA